MVAEAPAALFAAPEMAPEMKLARDSARELETALELEPVMELAKALEIAQSNRWVLSSQPWFSFVVADPLTWLGIVLPEVLAARASPKALAARASPEEELLSAAEGQE